MEGKLEVVWLDDLQAKPDGLPTATNNRLSEFFVKLGNAIGKAFRSAAESIKDKFSSLASRFSNNKVEANEKQTRVDPVAQSAADYLNDKKDGAVDVQKHAKSASPPDQAAIDYLKDDDEPETTPNITRR